VSFRYIFLASWWCWAFN